MVDKPITDQFIDAMANGVSILGVMTQKCEVKKETNYIFRITLVQGMNRQIRRMCEAFGYEVVQLERIRVMNITLKGLGVGDWRELTEREVAEIFEMTEKSTGTQEGSLPRRSAKPQAPVWTTRPPRKITPPGEKPVRKATGTSKSAASAPSESPDKPLRKPGRPAGAASTSRPGSFFQKGSASKRTTSRPPKGNSGTRGSSRTARPKRLK
jgi:23S rRNA pseudouridine2604 synthase